MKMKKLIFIVAVALCCCQSVKAQVGVWKNYLAYSDIQDVKRGGNTIYVLASNDLYSYNENDNSITTYDKVNGLNDCNISHIEWNSSQRKLLIVYSSYNIDILDAGGNITNMSDYYNASVSGNKDVYNIYMKDRFAYISTGFGIVKMDMRDAVISDTYNLHFRVDYCYIDGNYIYAASSTKSTKGLYRAALTANLLDPGQWERVGDYVSRNYSVDPELLAKAKSLSPGGPENNNFGFLRFYNGKLYSVGGGFDYVKDNDYAGIIQIYDKGNWIIDGHDVDETDDHKIKDVSTIDIDPTDESHFFVAGRTGLYEFRDNRFVKSFSYDNSPLKSAATIGHLSKNYVLVFTVKFDRGGNLWVFNSQSSGAPILKYTKGGKWIEYDATSLKKNNISLLMMKNAMFDRDSLLWCANGHFSQQGVVCYQPSTNGANLYDNFVNEDGTVLKVREIYDVEEDMEGNIWVATGVGPLYINYSDKTKSPDEQVFQQYKVPRNDGTDLADYLLSGVDVTGIAIDGANRKWFSTIGNGVYLISADNNTEVKHFMTDNSPLLSDNVSAVAIDKSTGEVFFATDKGLCSYMSDASNTVDKMSKDVTYAYPNPVKPGYTGPITITGLTYDADVKIVTSNGVLVAQGRSNGGSFVWDGNDLDGKRVASGVYMVQTATSNGDKGTVCKIAIVN